jgi:hypothetical protein
LHTRFAQFLALVASTVAVCGTAAATTASAQGASPRVSCPKPSSFGQPQDNKLKMNCRVTFSNGPKVKVRLVQSGSTLKIWGCAYGHRPRGFENVGLTSTLEANNETQAVDMPLHRSACTLGGETAGTWGSLKHGWHVVVDTTLFWRDRDGKEQLLTAPIKYTVA